MDKSHTILAHLFLDAEKFEYYYCKYPKIIIGVNMFQLFKLINSIDNDDTLTIYIEESEYSDGIVNYLGLKFENGDIQQSKNQKLKLIEPDEEELELPSVQFSSVINLPSSDFKKLFAIYPISPKDWKLNLLEMNLYLNAKVHLQIAN